MSGARGADDDARRPARAACTRGRTDRATATASPARSSPQSRLLRATAGRSSAWTPRLTPVSASVAGGPSNTTRRFSTIDAVEVVGDRAELVRDEQHAGAVLAQQVHERVAEQPLRLHVDAGDGLVEHEQLGLARQRLRDQHPLLLAARQLAHLAARASSAERDRLERVRRPRRGRRAWERRHQPCFARRPAATTSSTVAGRSGAKRGRCGTYPRRHRSRSFRGALPEQLDRPRGRLEQAERDPEERRLPGPVRARRGPTNSPAPDREVDVVEHGVVAVGEGHAVGTEEGRRPSSEIHSHNRVPPV